MKKVHFALLIGILLALFIPSQAWAVPAYSGVQTYVQPDQTVIEYRTMGDEYFHWKETLDGDVIFFDDDTDYYYYGQLKNNKVVKAAAKVGIDAPPFVHLTRSQLLSLADYAIRNAVSLGNLVQVADVPSMAEQASTSPVTLDPSQNLLVLLISFNNITIQESDTYWHNLFFGSSSSVNDYYDETSNGQLAFVPVGETDGTANDGVLRATLTTPHPAVDGYNDSNEMYESIRAAVETALEEEASQITNLENYDTDGDGVIETDELHIVTIFAGSDASASSGVTNPKNAIWAHAADYTGEGGIGDFGNGLCASGYIGVGEMMDSSNTMPIGVFCHELGHSLGLPDLYDYGGISVGLGVHSLMASGSWGYTDDNIQGSSPTHLDAWSKVQLGFVTPTVVDGGGLYPLYGSVNALNNVVEIPTKVASQYFLVEYRTFEGYDVGLANEVYEKGVAIYHIDEAMIAHQEGASINENRYRKGVDLEEANEGALGYSELDYYDILSTLGLDFYGDQYFINQSGMNIFGPDSEPSSGLYDKPITSDYAETIPNGTQNIDSNVKVTVKSLGTSSATVNVSTQPAFTCSSISNKTYTGYGIKPTFVVKSNSNVLALGKDYTATYSNNINPGKATIKIVGLGDYGGLSKTIYFAIVPKSLTSIKVQLNSTYSPSTYRYRTIKATWTGVKGATGYLVAYKSSSASTWTKTRVAGTSWSKVLSNGSKYYVKVKPYVTIDGTTRYYSVSYSPTKYVYTLKAPALSLAKYGTRSIKVSLGNVYSESGYQIYRKTSSGGKYYYKKTVTANTKYWIDTTTSRGKVYYYKIRAFKEVNGVKIYGPFSSAKNLRR